MQSPESNFINAAKKGAVDHLLGSVDALAWGKEAPLGTCGPFELLYSRKVYLTVPHGGFFRIRSMILVENRVVERCIWILKIIGNRMLIGIQSLSH